MFSYPLVSSFWAFLHTEILHIRGLFASTCIPTLHSLLTLIFPMYTGFPDDFTTTPNPPQLTFNFGAMAGDSQCMSVAAVADSDTEPAEEETVVIIQDDPSSFIVNGGSSGLSNFVIITVVDNDSSK